MQTPRPTPPATFGERVAAALDAAGMKQADLARRCKVRPSTVSMWVNGERQTADDLVTLAHALGVRPEWLQHGTGPMSHFLSGVNPQNKLAGASTGMPRVHLDESTISPVVIPLEEVMQSALPPRFAIVVPDDSMPPMRPGEHAIFAASPSAQPGQVVLAVDRDGQTWIREYRLRRADHWQAVARSDAYQPLDSVEDGLQVLAVQVGWSWG